MTSLKPNGYLTTLSGFKLNVQNPSTDTICIEDIATGLAFKPHFSGQTPFFFSIAQHCLMVADACPDELKLVGLLHDASEAYFVDMPKPLKVFLPEFQVFENRLQYVIFEKFGLDIKDLPKIKPMDLESQRVEFESFYRGSHVLNEALALSPKMAKAMFLKEFERLTSSQLTMAVRSEGYVGSDNGKGDNRG